MDVTPIPQFCSPWGVHFSEDTSSGFIFASAHIGKAVEHVIAYCLGAFGTFGFRCVPKTDSGLVYTSTAFQTF